MRPQGWLWGLVAITPGAGFVPIWSAFIIGALVSPICYFGVALVKKKLKIDDALDAFGCHGIGGIWGGVATGLFGKVLLQCGSLGRTDLWRLPAFCGPAAGYCNYGCRGACGNADLCGHVRIFTPLRVSLKEEQVGLDILNMARAHIQFQWTGSVRW